MHLKHLVVQQENIFLMAHVQIAQQILIVLVDHLLHAQIVEQIRQVQLAQHLLLTADVMQVIIEQMAHAYFAHQVKQVLLERLQLLDVWHHLVHLVIIFLVAHALYVEPIHMAVVEQQLHAQIVD